MRDKINETVTEGIKEMCGTLIQDGKFKGTLILPEKYIIKRTKVITMLEEISKKAISSSDIYTKIVKVLLDEDNNIIECLTPNTNKHIPTPSTILWEKEVKNGYTTLVYNKEEKNHTLYNTKSMKQIYHGEIKDAGSIQLEEIGLTGITLQINNGEITLNKFGDVDKYVANMLKMCYNIVIKDSNGEELLNLIDTGVRVAYRENLTLPLSMYTASGNIRHEYKIFKRYVSTLVNKLNKEGRKKCKNTVMEN